MVYLNTSTSGKWGSTCESCPGHGCVCDFISPLLFILRATFPFWWGLSTHV